MPAPLLISRDEPLLDELLRLAAAAGVTPQIAREPGAGLRSWLAAPMVLVGLDLAPELVRRAPPRRAEVVLVAWAGSPGEVYRHALELGAQDVVELPRDEPRLVVALGDLADPARARGLTLGVIGGCGGAGATTFACALGQVAARSGPALVMDTDPHGPGLDRVVGVETRPGIRWDDLQQTAGRLGAGALRDAVPVRGGLGVLTWLPGHAGEVPETVLREALSAAQRGHETVVLDLPRAGGVLTDDLVPRLDQLVVVTTATVLGVASTVRLCTRHPRALQRLVVRGRGVRAAEIAEVTGVPVVAAMSAQPRLDEWVDLGLGPVRSARGPLHRAATTVLRAAERLGSVR